MTLKQKLQLPSPSWLLFGLILLVIIGAAKLIMWLTPIIAIGIAKLIVWIAPLIWALVAQLATMTWYAVVFVAAALCAVVAYWWRTRKQTKLYEDIRNGTVLIINPESEVVN